MLFVLCKHTEEYLSLQNLRAVMIINWNDLIFYLNFSNIQNLIHIIPIKSTLYQQSDTVQRKRCTGRQHCVYRSRTLAVKITPHTHTCTQLYISCQRPNPEIWTLLGFEVLCHPVKMDSFPGS